MNFSQNFKAVWWFVLTATVSAYLISQYSRISVANVSWFDGLVFLSWLGLVLGPLFDEVNIFGFHLRSELRDMKQQLTREISLVRSDVKLISENSQTTNVYGTMASPPDSHLDEIEARVKRVVETAIAGTSVVEDDVENFIKNPESPEIDALFKARFTLEKEIRTIFSLSDADMQVISSRRLQPMSTMLSILVDIGFLEREMATAVKEVYSVCSPALHGEEVTPERVDFVRKTAPDLISALKVIRRNLDWEHCT